MNPATIPLFACAVLGAAVSLSAQLPKPEVFEPLPTLSASTILQPQYLSGPNFSVRDPVPTYSGSNQYTIDSDYGVFTADGNAMLMRRSAEIQGIAALEAMSQTSEFTQAAAQAAARPLNVAQDLITNPLPTIASVPRGILGFLNQAGQAVQNVAEGNDSGLGQGQLVENLSGFAKSKRDLALKLGVDPYCNNQVFQSELNKVAWPAFLGKLAVGFGMGAIGGAAGATIHGLDWTATLQASLRDKSPGEQRCDLADDANAHRCRLGAAWEHSRSGRICPPSCQQPGRTRGSGLSAERSDHGEPEQHFSGGPHFTSQRTYGLPDEGRHRCRADPVGLCGLDAHGRALHHGVESHAFRTHSYQLPDCRYWGGVSDRCRSIDRTRSPVCREAALQPTQMISSFSSPLSWALLRDRCWCRYKKRSDLRCFPIRTFHGYRRETVKGGSNLFSRKARVVDLDKLF